MEPHFNGPEYQPALDFARLTNQMERVKACMLDGAWRTLGEIEAVTGAPHASVSAQLRHLRKVRFGGFLVDKRARGERSVGLFEYRVRTSMGAVDRVTCETKDQKIKRLEARISELEDDLRRAI